MPDHKTPARTTNPDPMDWKDCNTNAPTIQHRRNAEGYHNPKDCNTLKHFKIFIEMIKHFKMF
jgi:hypothetical protein